MTNLEKIQAFFSAFASKDVTAVRETMAKDIIWRIPGHHPLAGEKRGIEEILAFFDQLGKAGFQAQPFIVAEQGDYVIDHHRGWSTVGHVLDLTWCLVFRFEDGKIKEVTNFYEDQHTADLFFYEVYKLKPILERLVRTLMPNNLLHEGAKNSGLVNEALYLYNNIFSTIRKR